MNEQFAFLKSVRFWNLVIISVIVVLKSHGYIIDQTLVDAISEIVTIVLGGSTIVRTIDRFAEKSGNVDTGNITG